ncbi:MAG: hypothetical protein HYX94_12430 [Chloroflexi bacterium]|nr:hypothetical protein [Chloroflexota bacterium]
MNQKTRGETRQGEYYRSSVWYNRVENANGFVLRTSGVGSPILGRDGACPIE